MTTGRHVWHGEFCVTPLLFPAILATRRRWTAVAASTSKFPTLLARTSRPSNVSYPSRRAISRGGDFITGRIARREIHFLYFHPHALEKFKHTYERDYHTAVVLQVGLAQSPRPWRTYTAYANRGCYAAILQAQHQSKKPPSMLISCCKLRSLRVRTGSR